MFSAEALTAIFTGLTGIIAALAALTANRSRRIAVDQRALRKRVRLLEKQIIALVEHTFTLELEIARRGGPIPERPSILEQLDDDGDEDDAPRASTHRR